jgi:membrane-associated phospholipid phosphatase
VVHLERLAVAVAMLLYAFGGYFWIGATVDPTSATTLATPLDARIPFVPESIYVYASVYLLIALPIFVIDSPALFRRAALAYAAIVTFCLLCFRFFPVSGAELRPALAAVEASPFVLWGLRLNYGLDPPVNLFPSLHVAGATIAAFAAGRARAAYGALAGVLVAAVVVAVCTIKQHYWVDAAAGVALAAAAWAALLRPYALPPGERAARGPASLAAFAGLLVAVYGLLYLAYRAGWALPAA